MVYFLHGTYKIQYHPNGVDTEPVYDVDFTPPFRRVNMYEGLGDALGVRLPDPAKLDTPGLWTEILIEIKYYCRGECDIRQVVCREESRMSCAEDNSSNDRQGWLLLY